MKIIRNKKKKKKGKIGKNDDNKFYSYSNGKNIVFDKNEIYEKLKNIQRKEWPEFNSYSSRILFKDFQNNNQWKKQN